MALWSLDKVKAAAMGSISGSGMPIAIDFGASSLKILQLQAGDPPQLVAAASLETPEALWGDAPKRYQFQCQALPRLIKGGGFKGKRAVFAIPAGQMFIKHMQFPKSEGVPIAELVGAGVPTALGCAPEALILRHFAVEGGQSPGNAGKQEVICMAAAREFVGMLMNAIHEAKLECVGIHPEAVATVKAFEHINRRAGDAHVATLYLDLAAATTKLWIAHAGALVFAKPIHLGGQDMDAVVARALDLTPTDARHKRLAATTLVPAAARAMGSGRLSTEPGHLGAVGAPTGGEAGATGEGLQPESDERVLTAADRREGRTAPGLTDKLSTQRPIEAAPPEFDLTDTLETLTDEIAMCLRYYESMFPGRRVDRAIFFGGEARHLGLCQYIARRIKLPGHVADPLARMSRTGKETVRGVDFTTPQPGWTIAFGLSMCPTDL